MGEAGEDNGQRSQETSEFSRVTSSLRVPTGWGLESDVGSVGQEVGQEAMGSLVGRSVGGGAEAGRCFWEQGSLQGTALGDIPSHTHCSGRALRLEVSLTALLCPSSGWSGCHPGLGRKWGSMRPTAP